MTKRPCDCCGEPYEALRLTSRFCSARCRVRNQRNPKPVAESPRPSAPVGASGAIEAATRAELAAAGRSDSPSGQIAVLLAARLDRNDRESGMGVAAVVREHGRVLADALKGARVAADPVDELRARRDSKRAG